MNELVKHPADGFDGYVDETEGQEQQSSLIQGALIKFTNEAMWVTRGGEELPANLKLIAIDCLRVVQRWKDKMPAETIIVQPGQPFPDVEAMNEAVPRDEWLPLERLLPLKPTDAEGRKLRDTVYVDCADKLFVFLKRRDAEPANNESERALRPSVIFRKVTNGFRSEWGAKTYADLCSIVETGRRNGRSALTAIREALALHVAATRPAHAG
jgi:hypothetical protein